MVNCLKDLKIVEKIKQSPTPAGGDGMELWLEFRDC